MTMNSYFSRFLRFLHAGKTIGRRPAPAKPHASRRCRLSFEALETRIAPAVFFWDGGSSVSDNWSDAVNWVGDAAPTAGNDLVFSGTVRLNPLNDLTAATVFNSITFNDGGFTLSGNSLGLSALTGGITSNAGTNTVNLNLTLATNPQTFTSMLGSTLIVAGNINESVNLTVSGDGDTTISGIVSGSGGLTKTGAGLLALGNNSNTYTGSTAVNAGTLLVTASNALGDSAGVVNGTTVAAGATLQVQGGISVNDLLTLSGALENVSGGNTWTGGVAMTGNSTVQVDTGSSLTIQGGTLSLGTSTLTVITSGTGSAVIDSQITGTGAGLALMEMGSGTLTLTNNTNSYTGNTFINSGVLLVTAANALGASGFANNTAVGGTLQIQGSISLVEDLDVNGTIVNVSGNNTLTGNIILNSGSPETVQVNTGSSLTIQTGTMTLGTGTWIFDVQGAGSATIASQITGGSGGLTKTGTGSLSLSNNANDYTGQTSVNMGTLVVSAANALGFGPVGAGNDTSVAGGACLQVQGGVSVLETVVLGGKLENVSGSNSWTGSISVATSGLLQVDTGSSLSVSGLSLSLGAGSLLIDTQGTASANIVSQITGTGTGSVLAKNGTGSLTLSNNANNYTGQTAVNAGTMIVMANALGAAGAGNDTAVAAGAILQIQSITSISVADVLNLSGKLENVAGSNAWMGNINVSGSPTIQVDTGSGLAIFGTVDLGTGSLTFDIQGTASALVNSAITGPGFGSTVIKTGSGVLEFAGINPYTDATAVNGGVLVVSGSSASSSGFTVNAGGILAGAGAVSSVNLFSGNIDPGNAPATPGILTTGNLTLDPSSNYVVQLNGASPGSGFDQLMVNGTVNLGGAALIASVGFSPALGSTFKIVDNDGSDPVSSTFAGLIEGAVFLIDGFKFQITYAGGDGNDVVLTHIPEVSFATAGASGSESATAVNIPVSLSGASLQTVTVNYAVSGGTASGSGVDFTLAAGTLTFSPGTVTQNIVVNVNDDLLNEIGETLDVALSSPTQSVLGAITSFTYTILDNDSPPAVFFSAPASNGLESASPANLTVALSAPSGQTVTVNYSVTGGTATGGGVDFTLTAGSLTFTPGVTVQNIPISINNDSLDEADETIVVTLASPTNATLGGTTVHTYTIVDDDGPFGLSLSLAATSVLEGGTAFLSGSFVDPGAPDSHSVVINWGDGTANTTLSLAAGVTAFGPTAHVYADDPPTGPDIRTITVTVTDVNGTTSASTSVTVTNVAPTVNAGQDGSVDQSVLFDRINLGLFSDPGADTFTATVNYGDGTGTSPLTLGGGTFSLNHTYTLAGDYVVTVVVTDDDGGVGVDTMTVTAVPPLPPSQISSSVSQTVLPGAAPVTQTVSNLEATLTRPVTSIDDANFTVALYTGNPTTTAPPNNLNTAPIFHDVRVVGANLGDSLTVTFRFNDIAGTVPVLMFFDEDALLWRAVQGSTLVPSSYVVDRALAQIRVIFDASSFPNAARLLGTVFTVALAAPVNTPVQTPAFVASARDIALIGGSGGGQANFTSSSQLTLVLTTSQDSGLSAGRVAIGPSRTAKLDSPRKAGGSNKIKEEEQEEKNDGTKVEEFWPWLRALDPADKDDMGPQSRHELPSSCLPELILAAEAADRLAPFLEASLEPRLFDAFFAQATAEDVAATNVLDLSARISDGACALLVAGAPAAADVATESLAAMGATAGMLLGTQQLLGPRDDEHKRRSQV